MPFETCHVTQKMLIVQNNKLLLTLASNTNYLGALEAPGGRVNLNESLEEGRARELLEEIGVDLSLYPHTMVLFDILKRKPEEYGHDNITSILEIYFLVHILTDEPLPLQTLEETAGFVWVDRSTNLSDFKYLVPARKDVYARAQALLE